MAVDYSVLFGGKLPGQALTQGIGQGFQLAQMKQQFDANKLAQEQAAKQLKDRQELQDALVNAPADAGADYWLGVRAKFDPLSAVSSRYQNAKADEKQAVFTKALNIKAAIQSDNLEIARSIFERDLEAAKNSGNQEAIDTNRILLQQLDSDPKSIITTANLFMAGLDPEKFADTYKTLEGMGLEAQKTQAEAAKIRAETLKIGKEVQTAADKSKFYEMEQAIKAGEAGFDISHLLKDPVIQKANTQLAIKTAEAERLEREGKAADLAKVNEEITTLKREREQLAADALAETRTKLQSAESSVDAIQNVLDLADVDVGFGRTAIDAATGSVGGALPIIGLEQNAANFANALETVKSQAFLNGIEALRGFGQLTEQEGKRLVAANRSLERTNDSKVLRENIKTILNLAKKAQVNIKARYGNYEKIFAEELAPAEPAQTADQDLFNQADAILNRGQ